MKPPDAPQAAHHKVAGKDRSRGALSNTQSRYIRLRSETVDDGWAASGAADGCEGNEFASEFKKGRVKTEFFADKTRTLITRNSSPDIPFDRSINPYKGCEHGCIYWTVDS